MEEYKAALACGAIINLDDITHIEFLEKIARIKVRQDSLVKQTTYLEKYGFLSNQMAYRNGSKKWTNWCYRT